MIGWHEHGIGPPASREPRSTERISIMSGEDTMDLCHAEPAVHEPAILPFDHDDAFGLDAQLSDEERLVRDTAEAFAQERLQPRVTSAFLEARFDREIMSELGELGLLGATRPDRYGDRKSVGAGTSVSVRVDLGGG